MVAESASRRKGLAREALRLMMAFGASHAQGSCGPTWPCGGGGRRWVPQPGPSLAHCPRPPPQRRPAHRELGTSRFVAKILDRNQPSLHLFEALGFTLLTREPDFEETHLVLDCGGEGEAKARLGRDVDALRVRAAREAELGKEDGACDDPVPAASQ